MENATGRLRGAGARLAPIAGLLALGCLFAPSASAQVFVEGSLAYSLGSYGEKPIPPPVPIGTDTHFEDLGPEGSLGGVGLGYHLRLGDFVVGPLFEFSGGDVSDAVSETDTCANKSVCGTRTITDSVTARWVESARLEAGYVVAHHLLFVGSYGWSRGGLTEKSVVVSTPGTLNTLPPIPTTVGMSGAGPVWTAGAEWILTDHWSIGFRYEDTTLDISQKLMIGGSHSAKYSSSDIVGDIRWYL